MYRLPWTVKYIVAADIFQDRNDVWTLVPFLKTMEEKLGLRYPSVTADSGYESEEGYSFLRENRQKPYIKLQTYEKWKSAALKKISANVKTCDMMKKLTHTPAMPGNHCPLLLLKSRKVRAAMNQK